MSDTPKYQEVSRMIEQEIIAGRWPAGTRLPGVRGIATRFGVSTVTAARSLQILRDRGLIRSVERGGSFPVINQGLSQPIWAACFRTTPGPWHRASYSTTMSGFESMARSGEIELATGAFHIGEQTGDAEIARMAREARAAGVGGLFLMPSRISDETLLQDESILRACEESTLPVVLIERNLRGRGRDLPHDLVSPDDLNGGYRVTRHLYESGRERVVFVQGDPISSHRERLAGFLLAVQETNLPTLVIDFPQGPLDRTAYAELATRVLDLKVDGVVCHHDVVAMGLILELLARRIRVPEDVAVTGFENLPIGDAFSIGLTTYGPDFDAIARRAVQIMAARIATPDAPPVLVAVPGRLIPRESAP